ncbi:Flp pilus assembly protein CpaB [Labrys wisconsinensis]|uniref:Pilus assembly protein CpaB n=1 Tax=Labrys wisconsinensis TaxID=425677 RepID=A0ABU0JDQ8_9HYPH|nr:Flp pilus assembly protein CpaB [Labrys wisconsinensis]MDQ0472414.1 pilus assembly protein CpaB [Labrys wisconsinensis]
MKTAQVAVLLIALAAAGGAGYVYLASNPAPVPLAVAPPAPVAATKVLVAASDINVGTALGPRDMRWQDWPEASIGPTYITDKNDPAAMETWKGAIVRTPFVAGEPLRAQKLVKANSAGFLSAILPAGMRAVATKIAVDTAVGGFILPNDRVDVILTRRDPETTKQTGVDAWTSEIILRNVRVLAIDQNFEEQDGQKVIAGSTATLELTPPQTEVLALGKEMGSISLSLRPLADANPTGLEGAATPETGQGVMGAGTVVRYGITNAAPR